MAGELHGYGDAWRCVEVHGDASEDKSVIEVVQVLRCCRCRCSAEAVLGGGAEVKEICPSISAPPLHHLYITSSPPVHCHRITTSAPTHHLCTYSAAPQHSISEPEHARTCTLPAQSLHLCTTSSPPTPLNPLCITSASPLHHLVSCSSACTTSSAPPCLQHL